MRLSYESRMISRALSVLMDKMIRVWMIICFFLSSYPLSLTAQAQEINLPAPGVMVHLSPEFNPPILKGIKVHTDNPFRFDFILDKGDSNKNNDQLNEESIRLIKYFLASITIPEKDLWVNLSPYEKDRIIPNSFGLTEMGRDLLAQDYMLKQITASLIYPEGDVGKKFWKRIYEEAQKKYGHTNIPVNTFNKVWIVPEKAVVYENAKAGTAYVVESKLKVMLEQDYLAVEKNQRQPGNMALAVSSSTLPSETAMNVKASQGQPINALGSQIIREIVIPELTKEVNEGKNFSKLRQVYQSLILATWYKKKIKDSILAHVYTDKNKVRGINIDDPQEKQKIYEQYLKAFTKGVYNYIKEEQNSITQEMIPRKYFSGGFDLAMTGTQRYNFKPIFKVINDPAQLPQGSLSDNAQLSILSATITQLKDAINGVINPWKESYYKSKILKKKGVEAALNKLGELGTESSIPIVSKIILDGEFSTALRMKAWDILMRIKKEATVGVVNQIKYHDSSFLTYAMEQLGRFYPAGLVLILSETSNKHYNWALSVARKFKVTEAVPVLMSQAEKESNYSYMLIHSLIDIGTLDAKGLFLKFARGHGDKNVRQAAIEGLISLNVPDLKEKICDLIRDNHAFLDSMYTRSFFIEHIGYLT